MYRLDSHTPIPPKGETVDAVRRWLRESKEWKHENLSWTLDFPLESDVIPAKLHPQSVGMIFFLVRVPVCFFGVCKETQKEGRHFFGAPKRRQNPHASTQHSLYNEHLGRSNSCSRGGIVYLLLAQWPRRGLLLIEFPYMSMGKPTKWCAKSRG